MDCMFGMVGDGYTLVMSDTKFARGPVIQSNAIDKMFKLNNHNLMLTGGELGDVVNFSEYIQRNVQLYEKQNGLALNPQATANFTRNQLAGSLRTRNAYQVNILMAGFDTKSDQGSLYYLDYLGSMAEAPFAVHGHAAYFCLSIFDKFYKKGMSFEEGVQLMKRCVDEMRVRYTINSTTFSLRAIDKDGVREVEAFA